MKISVITVTFNSAATLEDTLKSVIAQDFHGRELIVIDGGSTDGTLGIIERYRTHISKFVSEKDEGLYHALNKGIDLAEGDVIAILHSDDFYASNDVLRRYAAVFSSTGCDAAYSDLLYVHRDDPEKVIRRWVSGDFSRRSFRFGWMPPHPTFFAKKELYGKFGGFNTVLRTSADYELMLRFLYRYNARTCYLPIYSVKMRVGGQSNVSLRNRLAANKEDRLAWQLNGLRHHFFTLWLKPLRKIGQFFRRSVNH